MRNSWLSWQPRFRLTFFLFIKGKKQFLYFPFLQKIKPTCIWQLPRPYLHVAISLEQWDQKIIPTTRHLCAMKERLGFLMVGLGIRRKLEGVTGERWSLAMEFLPSLPENQTLLRFKMADIFADTLFMVTMSTIYISFTVENFHMLSLYKEGWKPAKSKTKKYIQLFPPSENLHGVE